MSICRSFSEISNVHFIVLKNLEEIAKSVQECLNYGMALFQLYISLEVRVRFLPDLKSLNYLLDNSNEFIKLGGTKEDGAVVILLLLCSLFNHKGKYYNEYLRLLNKKTLPERLNSYIDFEIKKNY